MLRQLFLLFSIVSFIGCSSEKVEKTYWSCENERRIFCSNDTLVPIKLNLELNLDSAIKIIRQNPNKFSSNDGLLEYNLSWEDKFNLLTQTQDWSVIRPIGGGWYQKCVLRVNMNHEILMENEYTEIDSVRFIAYQCLMENELEKYQIRIPDLVIQWDSSCEIDIVTKVLEQGIQGYRDFFNWKSKRDFGKVLCQLDSLEFDQFSRENKFRLNLPLGQNRLPPPPPPLGHKPKN